MNLIELRNTFEELGIKKGTKLLVTSDILRLWANIREEDSNFQPKMIIDILKDIVTESGTLVFPTYNWGFCQGKIFDIKKTKCKTGALGQVALGLSEFKRTKHPIYSFAVWGIDATKLLSINNKEAFGKHSPFAYFHENNFRNLIIDVSYKNSFTFIHYVESCIGVIYRYKKKFTAEYIDINNISTTQTYSMYVRNLDLDVEIPDSIEVFLDNSILYRQVTFGDFYIKTVDFIDAYDVIRNDIINNNSKNIAKYIGQI